MDATADALAAAKARRRVVSVHAEFSPCIVGWLEYRCLIGRVVSSLLAFVGSFGKRIEAPLEWSYSQFLKLERAAIESEETQRYWREQIDNNQFTQIPRWRSSEKHEETDEQQFRISHSLPGQLKELAQQYGLPLKSILLAVHLRVLSLLSGQRNVISGVVGTGGPRNRVPSE